MASRFPPSNNQLSTSSNPRNQETIHDGRVTVQQVQGRQSQSFAGTGNRGIATTSRGNYAVGQPRVVKCYNCQGEGHMARQCTQPKRLRNAAWFKEKLMLAKAQEADSQMDDLIRNRNAKLAAFQQEIDTLKETLSNHVKEKESLSKTLTVFKTESKEKESKYIDKEIVLEKQNKELENIISQRIQPTLYDGSVIAKEHAVISVIDDEETLILEEESRSKMLDKQNDPNFNRKEN
ncbi:retrovirus-related pol polyprotein from transposon TNT 1-94 [Tanacetum coccineum]